MLRYGLWFQVFFLEIVFVNERAIEHVSNNRGEDTSSPEGR